MNTLDIIILLFLLVSFIVGFKDGFVRKLIGTLSFILALYLSVTLSGYAGKVLSRSLGTEIYFSELAGGFSVFLLIMVAGAFLKRAVHPFEKLNNLLNRIIGGVVGLIQVAYFLSAVLFLANIFGVPSRQAQARSILYNRIAPVLPATVEYLSRYSPKAKDTIKNYIFEKDTLK